MNKKIFQSQVSFKLEFFSKLIKLAFLSLIMTLTIQLNADDKSGIKKSGSTSQTIKLIRTRGKGARTLRFVQ